MKGLDRCEIFLREISCGEMSSRMTVIPEKTATSLAKGKLKNMRFDDSEICKNSHLTRSSRFFSLRQLIPSNGS